MELMVSSTQCEVLVDQQSIFESTYLIAISSSVLGGLVIIVIVAALVCLYKKKYSSTTSMRRARVKVMAVQGLKRQGFEHDKKLNRNNPNPETKREQSVVEETPIVPLSAVEPRKQPDNAGDDPSKPAKQSLSESDSDDSDAAADAAFYDDHFSLLKIPSRRFRRQHTTKSFKVDHRAMSSTNTHPGLHVHKMMSQRRMHHFVDEDSLL